ncbi:MAG: hypothetical protein H7126_13790, partial [Candidatus Parcubacteria bacterium]|nr:hypothetical protein [Leptolyngbyaceae cyanobacterium LF-bin-113]
MDEARLSSDRSKIVKHLETIDQRAAELYKNIGNAPTEQPRLALSYIEALANALEELRVVEEEVCEHHEELYQA